jgi:hypothetical protein
MASTAKGAANFQHENKARAFGLRAFCYLDPSLDSNPTRQKQPDSTTAVVLAAQVIEKPH